MRIKPDGYFAISIALAILLHFLLPFVTVVGFPYSIIGVLLIIIGLWLTSITNSILLKERTSYKPLGTPSTLIVYGPFRFSRNPIYLGMTVILFGVATLLGSLPSLISPLLFAITINRLFIPAEEQKLEEVFQDKYLAYKLKVRRWI